MDGSMQTHDERQWEGIEKMMARSAAGEVAIPELEMVAAEEAMEEEPVAAFHPGLVGQGWSWSCTAEQMAAAVGGVNWCPTPPRSPEREASVAPWFRATGLPCIVSPETMSSGNAQPLDTKYNRFIDTSRT